MQESLKSSKHLRWGLLGGLLYTLGAIISWWMLWIDLHDRYIWLESVINSAGEFFQVTLYGKIYARPIFDSIWVWPGLFGIGFIVTWLLLFAWSHLKRRSNKR